MLRRYTKLTPYGLPLVSAHERSGEPLTRDTWRALLGKKERFPDLHDFFAAELERLGTAAFVREYAPQLVPGAAGALVHAVIHFGWAVDAGNACMIAEGACERVNSTARAQPSAAAQITFLWARKRPQQASVAAGAAYMAYTFVDIQPERLVRDVHSEVDPCASLQHILRQREAGGVRDTIDAIKADLKYSQQAGFHPELIEAGFQWDVAKVRCASSAYGIPGCHRCVACAQIEPGAPGHRRRTPALP